MEPQLTPITPNPLPSTPAPRPYQTTLLIAVIGLIILLFGGFFIYLYFFVAQTPAPTPVAPTIAPSPFPSVESNTTLTPPAPVPSINPNPADTYPKSNPFATKTNPFEDTYKNPFQ